MLFACVFGVLYFYGVPVRTVASFAQFALQSFKDHTLITTLVLFSTVAYISPLAVGGVLSAGTLYIGSCMAGECSSEFAIGGTTVLLIGSGVGGASYFGKLFRYSLMFVASAGSIAIVSMHSINSYLIEGGYAGFLD